MCCIALHANRPRGRKCDLFPAKASPGTHPNARLLCPCIVTSILNVSAVGVEKVWQCWRETCTTTAVSLHFNLYCLHVGGGGREVDPNQAILAIYRRTVGLGTRELHIHTCYGVQDIGPQSAGICTVWRGIQSSLFVSRVSPLPSHIHAPYTHFVY